MLEAMTYDLLIQNGIIIDPNSGTKLKKDIAIAGGKIAAIEKHIRNDSALDVIEADGLFVTPGLVDLHVHVWWGVAHLGIEADPACLYRGVTTAIDAGSAGANTMAGFNRYVIEQSKTRLFAFLHISGMGQLDNEIGELQDIRWANVEKAVDSFRLHRDRIVGIKVRLTDNIVGDKDLVAIDKALQAAKEIDKPLMIHIGGSAHPLEDILPKLRPGDIVTHAFTGHTNGILDNRDKVKDVAWDANKRGVIFDVGHGAGSFSFRVQEKALEDGFLPQTVSSDVHRYNVRGPVFDLMTTLSKYLYLGLTIDQVIRLATVNPARAVNLEEHIGSLIPGCDADLSIIKIKEGPITLMDAMGEQRQANKLLVPVETIRAGRRFTPLHSINHTLYGNSFSH